MNEQIRQAVEILKNGGVVVFPTDTVWGIGCAVSNKKAIEKLYKIKKREKNKPTAILVADFDMASKYGEIKGRALELCEKYWPGGFTVIVNSINSALPDEILGESKTVGLRAPNHPVVLRILEELGEGLVTSSANFAGENPPKKRDEIDENLERLVDMVIEGESYGDDPSTIVDVTGDGLKVVRQGSVRVS